MPEATLPEKLRFGYGLFTDLSTFALIFAPVLEKPSKTEQKRKDENDEEDEENEESVNNP